MPAAAMGQILFPPGNLWLAAADVIPETWKVRITKNGIIRMDRLRELAVLVAVVDHGSLAAAARRLRRSPPSVTRAIAALEERVGARLIERSTRRLAVTDAGRAFAEQARALLNAYDTAVGG